MDITTCLEGRTSVRDFKADPVNDEVVTEALRMANLAPSAGNLQARDFIVVKNSATKKALAAAAFRQDFIRTAPVVIVCCANLKRIEHYGDRGLALYCLQDVASAIENMMLYLFGEGLGAVWVGAFDEAKVVDVLSLPKHARPVAIVPIGYPAGERVRRRRLRPDEIVHWERW